MTRGLDYQRETYDDKPLEHLHCFGCAHSAYSEPWPGLPSGERPCGFCVRNNIRVTHMNNEKPQWYDGSTPLRNPMDCYQTLDMQEQHDVWMREAETNGAEALNRLIDLRTRLGGLDGGH